jgi:hypothetical protein
MASRIVNSLRIAAVATTLNGLPAAIVLGVLGVLGG